jgi:hypothetical protein
MRRYFTESPRHVQSESVDFGFWFSLPFEAYARSRGVKGETS